MTIEQSENEDCYQEVDEDNMYDGYSEVSGEEKGGKVRLVHYYYFQHDSLTMHRFTSPI